MLVAAVPVARSRVPNAPAGVRARSSEVRSRLLALSGALALAAACRPPAFIEPNAFLPTERTHVTARSDAGPARVLWRARLGISGSVHAVAIGPDGRIAVGGAKGPREHPECFLRVLDRDGHQLWDDSWSGRCGFVDVAFAPDGGPVASIRLVANFSSGADFPRDASDVAIVSWSAAGEQRWAVQFKSDLEDVAGPLAVDDRGDVHTVMVLPGESVSRPIERGGTMLATLSGATGELLATTELPFGIRAVDLAAVSEARGTSVYLAGVIDNRGADFGKTASGEAVGLAAPPQAGGKVAFVLKVDDEGLPVWAYPIVSAPSGYDWYDLMPSVAVREDGRVAVVANRFTEKRRVTVAAVISGDGTEPWRLAFETDVGDGNRTAVAWGGAGGLWVGANVRHGFSYVEQDGPLVLAEISERGELVSSSAFFGGAKLSPGPLAIDPRGRVISADVAFHGKQYEQPDDDVIVHAFGLEAVSPLTQ